MTNEHGIMSNGAVKIPVTLNRESATYWVAWIDGIDRSTGLSANNFHKSAGWNFTPDAPPLPTGLWSVIVGPDDDGDWAPCILTGGGWVSLERDGSVTYREIESDVRSYIDKYGFRVVHEGITVGA